MSRYPLAKLNHYTDGCAVPFIVLIIAIVYFVYAIFTGK